jgi:hypothetical protein
MNEDKWPSVASIVSRIMDLHGQQMEMIELLIKTLMDEDNNGSQMETNKAVLERV